MERKLFKEMNNYEKARDEIINYFFSTEENSSSTIAEELGYPQNLVLKVLRDYFDHIQKNKEKSLETYSLIEWKKIQREKLIAALKMYNELVDEQDKVNI